MSNAFLPESKTADVVTLDTDESGRDNGRHRARKVFRSPATW
ncbi:hypothetical protein [Ornithinimicrobium sp. INDO-MA30-4]|nr:hypothetical protein [Ornithinimicrobium sp. INDO-MA30-4]